MSRLNRYLKDRKRRPAEFARELGISKSYLSEILNGKKGVSLDLALKIERITKGGVSTKDMAHREKSTG